MRYIRKISGQNGQALVEMAIVVPVLLLIVFGIVEFGRGFNEKLLITNAARQGVRTAAVDSAVHDPIIADDILSILGGTANRVVSYPTLIGTETAKIEWTQTWGSTTGYGSITFERFPVDLPTKVSITIDYPFYVYMPFVSLATGNPIDLQSSATMRIETD
ncbi:MAG: TadE/TadG family type IV pilus assembly protein [Syntrophomonadaceae bacterium]